MGREEGERQGTGRERKTRVDMGWRGALDYMETMQCERYFKLLCMQVKFRKKRNGSKTKQRV